MLIEKLDISDFRGIKKCEKKLEFSKLSVLIGRNNSGKTAILEAIYLFLSNRVIDQFYNQSRDVIVQISHGGAPKSLIYNYSGEATIDYWIDSRKISMKIDDHGNYSHNISGEKDKLFDILQPNAFNNIFNLTHYEDLGRLFLFIPAQFNISDLIQIVNRESDRITKSGTHKRIIDLLNECLNEEYTEIIIETMKVRKEILGNVMYIKLADLGHGLVKTIPTLLMIETFNPKFVLWDDFEISAHPSLIRTLLKWLSEKDIQIIMTTHSIDVLSELIDVCPKDASVLQLSKTQDDVLKHQKLDLNELEIIMEKGSHDPRLLTEALQL